MRNTLNLLLTTFLLSILFVSCRDVIAPEQNDLPQGAYIVWFNGLSGNADGYFLYNDTLVSNAWLVGEAPNQIIEYVDGKFAVLSSLSSEIRFFSGINYYSLSLPEGSNPYSFCIHGNTGYTVLLLQGEIIVFDLASKEITETFTTKSNSSGIAFASNKLFVSYGNYPESSSPGGVSVISADSGEELKWLNTGINTHWLKTQPTGNVHAYSTTYQNDGVVSVINPESMQIEAVINCGGAPGEGISVDDYFLSPDGWGEGGLIKYDEYGNFSRIALPFSPTNLVYYEERLFVTSFASDKVYILSSSDYSIIDSLQAGGQGPQGIIAIEPIN